MLCLTVESDDGWATAALHDLDTLLVDHAHCEMKAASNALSLISRFAMPATAGRALSHIAKEEVVHFEGVLALLEGRGLSLGPPPVDAYAAALRRATGRLEPWASPLVDRLLVGAIIEARSCERFKLLAIALEASASPDLIHLRDFYRELLAAEAGHYRTFVDLACEVAGPQHDESAVVARLAALARLEASIVASLADGPASPTIHG